MPESVLLDTSFFLRFLNDEDPLFSNADNYFRYFLEKDFEMFISTISIAEYCTGGSVDQLPLRNIRVLPFNYNHALRAGEFGKILFNKRKIGQLEISKRILIPNDAKMFAQSDVENSIIYYVTSDTESIKLYEALKSELRQNFEVIDINKPYNDFFGLLPLE